MSSKGPAMDVGKLTAAEEANKELMRHLNEAVEFNLKSYKGLLRRINLNVGLSIGLSVVVFCIGIVLVLVPLYQYITTGDLTLYSALSEALGLGTLLTFFFREPIERTHKYTGDLAQITLIITNFHTQLGLKLLQIDIRSKDGIGEATTFLSELTRKGLWDIEDFFEKKGPVPRGANKAEEGQ